METGRGLSTLYIRPLGHIIQINPPTYAERLFHINDFSRLRPRRRTFWRRCPSSARAPTDQRLLDINAIGRRDEIRRLVRMCPWARDGLFRMLLCLGLPDGALHPHWAPDGALSLEGALRNRGHWFLAVAAGMVRVVPEDGTRCGADD